MQPDMQAILRLQAMGIRLRPTFCPPERVLYEVLGSVSAAGGSLNVWNSSINLESKAKSILCQCRVLPANPQQILAQEPTLSIDSSSSYSRGGDWLPILGQYQIDWVNYQGFQAFCPSFGVNSVSCLDRSSTHDKCLDA